MPSSVDWPGAVDVVELPLGARVVDGVDRVAELAVVGHRAEAVDAGRRLLGAADDVAELLGEGRVDAEDEVRAVVQRRVRGFVDGAVDAPVEGLGVLAVPGVDLDAVGAVGRSGGAEREGRGHLVVGRERVAAAPRDLGAARLERLDEHGGLLGDVEAARDLVALEGLRLGVLLAQLHEHRHPAFGPLDAAAAAVGEREVCDFVGAFFVIHVCLFGFRNVQA